MIKRILFAATLCAATAHADPPRLGVEIGHTLGGVSGPGVRVDLSSVQLEALVDAIDYWQDVPSRQLDVGVRALVPLRRFADGWVGVVAGADLARGDRRGHALEGALHAEWFALPSVSLGLEVGVAHVVREDAGVPADPSTGQATHSTLAPSGGATFTFWF